MNDPQLFEGYEPVPADPYLILHCVSDFYRISPIDLQGPSRKQPLARQRQILMYMLRDFCYLSYPKIGTFLNRDHSTIMHGVKFVERDRSLHRDLDIELDLLRGYINGILDR